MKSLLVLTVLALLGVCALAGTTVRLQSRYSGMCVGNVCHGGVRCGANKFCPVCTVQGVPCNDTKAEFTLASDKSIHTLPEAGTADRCLSLGADVDESEPVQTLLKFQVCSKKIKTVFTLPKANKAGAASLKGTGMCITANDEEREFSAGATDAFLWSECAKKADDEDEYSRQRFVLLQ